MAQQTSGNLIADESLVKTELDKAIEVKLDIQKEILKNIYLIKGRHKEKNWNLQLFKYQVCCRVW